VSPPDGGEPAIVAPPDSTSFRVEGMTLEAGGREIALVLAGDFDGDGKKDALAVVRPPVAARPPGAPSGDLVYFHGGEPAAAIASGPAVGLQASCTPVARLEKLGATAAFAEIGSTCPRGAGSRAIVVVRLPRAGGAQMPAVAFDALVVDPNQAPKLAIAAESVDRDKDGLDDVVLRLSLEGEKGSVATSLLAFFDRPAGPSRDPDEPEASLGALAALATPKIKSKDVSGALSVVNQVRALYRASCAEGGAPRLTKIHGGDAASCGASKALEDVGVAEVRALALHGDALRAFAAAEIAQLAPATKRSARSLEIKKALADVAPVTQAASVRALAAPVDLPHDHHPEWGPLAFEASGKLLVRHGASVVRVDPETGDQQASDVAPWKDEVLSPDGRTRWLEAYHACEGVALRATFAQTADGDLADVVLPVAPRLGKSCSGARGDPAPAIPVAWGSRGLEALVAGQPVLIKLDPAPEATSLPVLLDEPGPFGSPRSPGKTGFAFAVGSGVLVKGRAGERWALVNHVELEPYADLRRCVVNDDASKLACVRRGSVVVATIQ
jgi:hypothetical protein